MYEDGTNVPIGTPFLVATRVVSDLYVPAESKAPSDWEERWIKLRTRFEALRDECRPIEGVLVQIHEPKNANDSIDPQTILQCCEGRPKRIGGLFREHSALLTPEGRPLFGAFAILDANGTPICNSAGDPFAYSFGLRRNFYLYPGSLRMGESRPPPGQKLMELIHEATGLLVQLPSPVAIWLWRNWRSGFSLALMSHEQRWLDAVFELSWQRHFGHPSRADRFAWHGSYSVKLYGDGLFPRLSKESSFPGDEWITTQNEIPMAHYSMLPDVVRASLAAIDEILERGRSMLSKSNRRFSVALSFPGEHRRFVEAVASVFTLDFRLDPVLFNKYHEAEFAQPNLDTHLQHLYHDESDLIVTFLCVEYSEKEWCGLEWGAIRDLIKRKQSSRIMLLRFDNAEIPGLFSTDGYAPIDKRSPQEIADLILKRMQVPAPGIATLRGDTPLVLPASEQFELQFRSAAARFDDMNPLKARKYTGYRESAFFPIQFQADRFTLEELHAAAERAHVNFTGWPFLAYMRSKTKWHYAIEDGLETLIERNINDERLDFWQLRQSGFFYHRFLMWEESHRHVRGESPAMHIDSLAKYIAQAIDCLTRLYENLLLNTDRVEFQLRVLGTENRVLATFDSRHLHGSYVCRIPSVSVRHTNSLGEWKSGLIDHADEITREVFLRFNWQQPGSFRKTIEEMFSTRQ